MFQRIFRRPDYHSEISQFITALKTANPDLEAQQRAGRARLWDKEDLDRELQRDWAEAKVAQKPYVYGSGAQ